MMGQPFQIDGARDAANDVSFTAAGVPGDKQQFAPGADGVERIDQEDYGYCDTCGVEIGLRRLEARPTASQCVDCKSLDELRERQLHG